MATVPGDVDKEQPLDSYLRELAGFAMRASQADAIEHAASRAAALEQELVLLNEALDLAAEDYYYDYEHPQFGYGAHPWQQIRREWLCEAQAMLDVKARAEAEGSE